MKQYEWNECLKDMQEALLQLAEKVKQARGERDIGGMMIIKGHPNSAVNYALNILANSVHRLLLCSAETTTFEGGKPTVNQNWHKLSGAGFDKEKALIHMGLCLFGVGIERQAYEMLQKMVDWWRAAANYTLWWAWYSKSGKWLGVPLPQNYREKKKEAFQAFENLLVS